MAPGLGRFSGESCPTGSFIQDQATVYISGSGWVNRMFNKPACFPMRNKQLLKIYQGILKVQIYTPSGSSQLINDKLSDVLTCSVLFQMMRGLNAMIQIQISNVS